MTLALLMLVSVSALAQTPPAQPGQLFNIMGKVDSKSPDGVFVSVTWCAPVGQQLGGPISTVFISNFPNLASVYDNQVVTCIGSYSGTKTDDYNSTVRSFSFSKEGTSR